MKKSKAARDLDVNERKGMGKNDHWEVKVPATAEGKFLKKPLFNHTKQSCIICRGLHFDNIEIGYGPDWYTYMCEECMEKHSKKWGIEFE